MPLLTDQEATDLATLCPPHKIIIDGPQLIGLVQSACTLAYQPSVFDLILEDDDVKTAAFELAMTIHDCEKAVGEKLKALAGLAAGYAASRHRPPHSYS